VVDNGSVCRVKERPDGLYVVRGDRAVGPYESALLPEAKRRKIAEEPSVPEEEVKKALRLSLLVGNDHIR